MATILNDLPAGIVALKVEENTTKDEFIKRANEAVLVAAKQNTRLNLLLVIDALPSEFEKGAWLETFFSAIKSKHQWQKAAIVGEGASIEWFKTVISYFNTVIYEFFSKDQLNAAIERLTQQEDETASSSTMKKPAGE